ncbi:CCA tRNA nucleotidyltransferase [Porphyromonas sp. COT-108 OH2963]|uniref:CCA tRNA nucleotidyltransferase n=1 Tax=Porphyromonas sp. COT-108 OH2963 TaxID=1515614 RepID=UPI0009DF8C46|nr:HD domain-containing protein [Porphyromonas sp. COT-108 OH2963]
MSLTATELNRPDLSFRSIPESLKADIEAALSDGIFEAIARCTDELGLETYIIGGFVRDIVMHRPSKDIDIVCVGNGIELAQALKKNFGKKCSLSVFKNFGTAQIKYKGYEVEFVGARKESYRSDSRKPIVEDGTLEDDLIRRDLTINAMAISLNKESFGAFIDPFDGLKDVENRLIRTPQNPDATFEDDPLRMMRAIRFATQLDFVVVPEVLESIVRKHERIEIISMERISDEFKKIILSPRPSLGLELMMDTGLLSYYLPELVLLKGAETIDGVGHKENFSHSLIVLDNIANVTSDLYLRLAGLFHDIAKPKTKRYEKGFGWSFHNHNIEGARMIPKIFKRIKLPLNDKMKYVQKLVFLHMRPSQLADEGVTDSAIRRLLFDAGDHIDDLMTLCEADISSKNPKKVEKYLRNFAIVRQKLVEVEEKDRIRNFKSPITGEMIMQLYNLSPSKEVGVIKEAIKEAILDGKIQNEYDEAYAYMLDIAKKMGLSPVEIK